MSDIGGEEASSSGTRSIIIGSKGALTSLLGPLNLVRLRFSAISCLQGSNGGGGGGWGETYYQLWPYGESLQWRHLFLHVLASFSLWALVLIVKHLRPEGTLEIMKINL